MLDNWKDLIRPKLEIRSLEESYGRFELEAFERGFGTTIGNALRRVLLSSLKGAAITAIKIDGVLHEFSTMDGVAEDVTDMNTGEILAEYNEQITEEKFEEILARGIRSFSLLHVDDNQR